MFFFAKITTKCWFLFSSCKPYIYNVLGMALAYSSRLKISLLQFVSRHLQESKTGSTYVHHFLSYRLPIHFFFFLFSLGCDVVYLYPKSTTQIKSYNVPNYMSPTCYSLANNIWFVYFILGLKYIGQPCYMHCAFFLVAEEDTY